jgi:hypothetical protein
VVQGHEAFHESAGAKAAELMAVVGTMAEFSIDYQEWVWRGRKSSGQLLVKGSLAGDGSGGNWTLSVDDTLSKELLGRWAMRPVAAACMFNATGTINELSVNWLVQDIAGVAQYVAYNWAMVPAGADEGSYAISGIPDIVIRSGGNTNAAKGLVQFYTLNPGSGTTGFAQVVFQLYERGIGTTVGGESISLGALGA